MTKPRPPARSGLHWTAGDDEKALVLFRKDFSAEEIAKALERTPGAIEEHLWETFAIAFPAGRSRRCRRALDETKLDASRRMDVPERIACNDDGHVEDVWKAGGFRSFVPCASQ